MSYPNLKQNKTFKEKVDYCVSSKSYPENSTQIRKTLKQDNIHDVALIMFYNNRKLIILNVLSVVVS